MKRVLLRVAYDGTGYCGWQRQPNGRTVEDALNLALARLLKEEIQVIGASRTDSGVHAYGNVAVFDTESRIPAEKLSYAVNQGLPDDIRVVSSFEVPLDFHPRHTDSQKTYEYHIRVSDIPFPTNRLYAHSIHGKLDVEKMREAAVYIIGEHDFTSFCSVDTQVEDKVRTVYTLDVTEKREPDGSEIVIHIEGSGFLYNMVRIIAGTLIQAGQGRIRPEEVKDIIEAKDRKKAGPTAPAKGLFLVKIDYL